MTEKQPIRYCIIVNSNHAVWQRAWNDPQAIITQVLRHFQHDELISIISTDGSYDSSDCRLLVVERWQTHTFLVCNLYNSNYDFDNAHLEGNNELPVKMVSIQKSKMKMWWSTAMEQMVNKALREAHNKHGWETHPPYSVQD